MIEIKHEKGNFLSDEMKKIKAEITVAFVSVMPTFFQKYPQLGDDQESFTDIYMSSLIMSTREMLFDFIINSNALEHYSDFIDHTLGIIKEQTQRRINEYLTENKRNIN